MPEAPFLRRYMIVDLKKFTPGKDLQPGLLWIAEQIPGLVASRDMTEQLARGYWPSYNIPYFQEVQACTVRVSTLILQQRAHNFLNTHLAGISYTSGLRVFYCILSPDQLGRA